MRRRLLCRLGKHRWQQRHTDEDNQLYRACELCDAVDVGPVGTYRDGEVPPAALL